MNRDDDFTPPPRAAGATTNLLRRRLLVWFPAAVFGSVAATLAAAAFRFLRPEAVATDAGHAPDVWVAVAPVSELEGASPAARTLTIERAAGWARARTEHLVYVLPPRAGHRVVSAACPHEGCEVVWRGEARDFFCPCHDSSFSAEGERLSGPAPRGLEQLPTRVSNGVLEVLPGAVIPREQQETPGRG